MNGAVAVVGNAMMMHNSYKHTNMDCESGDNMLCDASRSSWSMDWY
jgi:hypothetical protein